MTGKLTVGCGGEGTAAVQTTAAAIQARAPLVGCCGMRTAAWSNCCFPYGAKPTEVQSGEDWPGDAHTWLRVSPLHEAARKGDVREAKKLLRAKRGHDEIARLLA